MAKDKEEKKDEKAEKPEAAPEEAAAKSSKKRLLIFIIGGVLLLGGIGAGLALFLAGGKTAAKAGEGEGEAKAEEAKKEEHGEKKEEHAEKKEGEKKEEHGEKKEEHAEKKEEHGEKKEGEEHGEKKEGEKKEGEKKEEKKDAKDSKIEGVDFGCTFPFQPFHLNLGNPLENRYVRLEIALEFGCTEETKAELEKRLPQLRDAVISVTSRKTREFLLGPDGKEQLRKEIHTRVNQYMSRKVDDVFITDILIE